MDGSRRPRILLLQLRLGADYAKFLRLPCMVSSKLSLRLVSPNAQCSIFDDESRPG
jgi:hypothetical protein